MRPMMTVREYWDSLSIEAQDEIRASMTRFEVKHGEYPHIEDAEDLWYLHPLTRDKVRPLVEEKR